MGGASDIMCVRTCVCVWGRQTQRQRQVERMSRPCSVHLSARQESTCLQRGSTDKDRYGQARAQLASSLSCV